VSTTNQWKAKPETWESYLRRTAQRNPNGSEAALIAELDKLRSFRAGVPWDALLDAQITRYTRYDDAQAKESCRLISVWLEANAPQPEEPHNG
jgi:hypothetical protein